MAIIVRSGKPQALLDEIRRAIDAKRVGQWRCDKDGDFVLIQEAWRGKAWLRPSVKEGQLTLNVLGRKDEAMSKGTYAHYHSAFIDMLLLFFDDQFLSARATALPTSHDKLGRAVEEKKAKERAE